MTQASFFLAVVWTAVEVQPAPPAAPREPSPGTPPQNLAVGSEGRFKPGLLLQGWLVTDRAAETTSTFRLRRAEIHLKGELVPASVAYAVMFDPAKVLEPKDTVLPVANQDPPPVDPGRPESVSAKQPVSAISALQDVYLTFRMPYADVAMGQFKIPVSWEGYNSSASLLFAERALVAREFGDKRDLGLRFGKSFERFGYLGGIFNGSGPNALDGNVAKDGALRIELFPLAGLVVAGAFYASLWDRQSAGSKDRYEANLRYAGGRVLLQAEYLRTRDVGAGGQAVPAHGFYAALAYQPWDALQPCVRIGYFDPDADRDLDPAVDRGKDETWHLDAGLNFYFRKHEAKAQLNYSLFRFQEKSDNHEVILATQIAF